MVHLYPANKVGDKGATALGEMMKTNSGLQILHLCGILETKQIKGTLF